MAADLAEHLQASLGSSYTIVREFGGGGMSPVFLADDKTLDADGRLRLLGVSAK